METQNTIYSQVHLHLRCTSERARKVSLLDLEYNTEFIAENIKLYVLETTILEITRRLHLFTAEEEVCPQTAC